MFYMYGLGFLQVASLPVRTAELKSVHLSLLFLTPTLSALDTRKTLVTKQVTHDYT